MKRGNGFARGLVIGITVFICMAGTLWNPSASQAAFSDLHDFNLGVPQSGGGYPQGSLTSSGSTLYGMTPFGGANGSYGTIFQMNSDGSGYQVVHSFSNGTTDGAYPYGSLTLSGSTLYGMTSFGGANGGYGTIFKMNTDRTGYQVLYSFSGGTSDGAAPYGSLTLSGSTLYGMTSGGGVGGYGTIFQMNSDGTGYKLLYSFLGGASDGANPYGSLTLAGSTLYGMTNYGGANGGYGTIFQINTDGSGYKLLHDFYTGGSSDGEGPYGDLTLSESTLYGMTNYGGANGDGNIFRMNTDGTGFQDVHDFSGASDGAYPYGSLTLAGSTLYGMTQNGGSGNYGTIFQMNTDGSGFHVLNGFSGGASDGATPYGSLTVSGSTLYGMASAGGANNNGTIFSLTVSITKTLLWSGAGGYAANWTLDSSNNWMSYTPYGPYSGWTPVNISSNPDGTRTLLWAGTGGSACIWTLDSSSIMTTYRAYGPYSGWTPTNYSITPDGTRTLLWAGTGGLASIWTLDSSNNMTANINYGPYSGWTPVSYGVNPDGTRSLLWRGTGGYACIWTLDSSNNVITYRAYGPYNGWTPVSYNLNPDGTRTLLWAGTGGSAANWTLDSSNNWTTYTPYGPYIGWTPASYSVNPDGTRTLLWAGTGGSACIWTLDGSNNMTGYKAYGPYSGWTPIQCQ